MEPPADADGTGPVPSAGVAAPVPPLEAPKHGEASLLRDYLSLGVQVDH